MLVGKTTELFVDKLARASQKMAISNRRKTIKCVTAINQTLTTLTNNPLIIHTLQPNPTTTN